MNAEKLSKLPKWAQEHIQMLESNLRYRDQQIAEILGEKETCVHVFDTERRLGLPNRCTVEFDLGDKFKVQANVVDDELRIYGSTGMQIEPRASNSIYIAKGTR